MLPSASIGTPRTTLPSATPSSSVIPRDAAKNTRSHPARHRALSRFERNSIDTARRMSTNSTSIIAV